MIVKYQGVHRGGLQQIGTLPIEIAWGEPVEVPDDLAEQLLESDDWTRVGSGKKKKADDAPTTQEGDES